MQGVRGALRHRLTEIDKRRVDAQDEDHDRSDKVESLVRAAREAAAWAEPVEPVQGPPLPSGEDTPMTDASAAGRSPAKPFLAGVAAGAGVLLAARRRKDDD